MKKIKDLVTWISNTKTCDFCALFNLRQGGYNTSQKTLFCHLKYKTAFYYVSLLLYKHIWWGGICRGEKKSAVEYHNGADTYAISQREEMVLKSQFNPTVSPRKKTQHLSFLYFFISLSFPIHILCPYSCQEEYIYIYLYISKSAPVR